MNILTILVLNLKFSDAYVINTRSKLILDKLDIKQTVFVQLVSELN